MTDRAELAATTRSKAPAPAASLARDPDPLKGGDVYRWAMDQAALIRARRYDEIDWVNVADEIESVGKSEFRSLASHVEVVLTHMLKWDHQPARRSRSWLGSIERNRLEIETDLSDNPSLTPRVSEAVERGYRLARYGAARQTRLPIEIFPVQCPYEWVTVMTRPFVLDQTDEAP